MTGADGNLVAPVFLPSPRPPALLVIDAAAKRVRRYARNPLGGREYATATALIEPESVVAVLGEPAARAMLENFRKTGNA